ncbi:unnamed protein product, partial [Effrenium voratum]
SWLKMLPATAMAGGSRGTRWHWVLLALVPCVCFITGTWQADHRPISRVQMSALKRLTKKEKIMKNVARVREVGVRQLSNRLIKKQLNQANKIAEDDAWVNEFLSYSRPTPVGGEYVMPSEVAMAALEEIYGEGPDLQNIDLEELEEETEEGTVMERLRRKKDASNFRR